MYFRGQMACTSKGIRLMKLIEDETNCWKDILGLKESILPK